MARHSHGRGSFVPGGLVILHEDRDIIVVDKPAGLLTISTEREKSRTAYFILTDYVRKGVAKSQESYFYRAPARPGDFGDTDFRQERSGEVSFAEPVARTPRKRYLAVVHGRCEKHADTITTYLAENQAHGVYTTSDAAQRKTFPHGLQSAQTNQRFSFAGSRLIDRQEAPDSRPSRRHRTPGGRRRPIWQRT